MGCMHKAMINAGISFERSPNVQKPREQFVNGKQDCMRKAKINAGISFERSPNVQKPREPFVNGKQKGKFAGTAKRNKSSNIAKSSLVPVNQKAEVSDSDDDPQPEYGAT